MRVIAGKARGHPLIAPDGLNTRPIPDMIKEALFSSWQMKLAGSHFLDLFAGSGSMGIEAMSRGAEKTVFVEKDHKAVEVIKKTFPHANLRMDILFTKMMYFTELSTLKLRENSSILSTSIRRLRLTTSFYLSWKPFRTVNCFEEMVLS